MHGHKYTNGPLFSLVFLRCWPITRYLRAILLCDRGPTLNFHDVRLYARTRVYVCVPRQFLFCSHCRWHHSVHSMLFFFLFASHFSLTQLDPNLISFYCMPVFVLFFWPSNSEIIIYAIHMEDI